ncbi:MAG: hypothetical protein ACU84Q_13905 [Gammaproteobacteria bacterium]
MANHKDVYAVPGRPLNAAWSDWRVSARDAENPDIEIFGIPLFLF